MEEAAEEEIDHLAWCEQRIRQLGSRPSVLNPIFYGLSFGVGAAAGLVSDRVSLGFVAATEDQVQASGRTPGADSPRGSEIPCHPRADAYRRGTAFEQRPAAGGLRFPAPVKLGMSLLAKVMTKSTYRI